MAKIVLIVGSVRQDRNGIKVARWFEQKLKERKHDVHFVDPIELNLPLLDRMYKEMNDPPQKLKELQSAIKNADGYLPITPEYNHSTSPAMVNTLDYFLEEYFFKPTAIVSYSVVKLRITIIFFLSCFKNCFLFVPYSKKEITFCIFFNEFH